jgi:hypothetical protein
MTIAMMRNRLRQFRRDTEAVVAIQVVIFAVLLFTASGMVIDFGRAYSAHSQMQGYVDKAALAAAEELDGGVDSMLRAEAAARAVAATSDYTEQGTFTLSDVVFLNAIPRKGDGSIDLDAALSPNARVLEGAMAEYVLILASPSSVRLTLLSLNVGDNGEADGPTAIPLRAYAVAKLEESICGGLSTLVMCNPFEGQAETFAEKMADKQGAQFLLTVDLDDLNEPRLTADDSRIRLGLLKNPHDYVGADPNEFCTGEGLALFQQAGWGGPTSGNVGNDKDTGSAGEDPNGSGDWGSGSRGRSDADGTVIEYITSDWTFPTTDSEYERLRDMCLLAMIDPGLQCISDQVMVKAALPGTITTGVNTIFDLWDAPLDRVLHTPGDANSAFAADYVAVHGLLNRQQFKDYIETVQLVDEDIILQDIALLIEDIAFFQQQADDATDEASRNIYLEWVAALQEELEFTRGHIQYMRGVLEAYPDNIANPASRVNHYMMGAGSGWGPMYRGFCLVDPENCDFAPYIDAPGGGADPTDESLVLYNDPIAWANGRMNLTSLGASASGLSSGWRLSNPSKSQVSVKTYFSDAPETVWTWTIPARSRLNIQVPGQGTMIAEFVGQNVSKTKATCPFTQCNYTGIASPVFQLDAPTTLASFLEYFASYYTPYKSANRMDLTSGTSEIEMAVSAAPTMYEGYRTVERVFSDLWDPSASNDLRRDTAYIGTEPEHYQFSAAPDTIQTTERRRQTVTLVNCGSAQDMVSLTGFDDPAMAHTYLADVVDVVDIFLTESVVVDDCIEGSHGADPEGINPCWNEDISRAHIYAEFIGSAGQADLPDTKTRSYAVLVN